MFCSFLWYCSAPSYGIALLLPMVLLCSFLWSCSAPSYGIAFGKSRVWFAVLFKYLMKNTYLPSKQYIFRRKSITSINIYKHLSKYIKTYIQIYGNMLCSFLWYRIGKILLFQENSDIYSDRVNMLGVFQNVNLDN